MQTPNEKKNGGKKSEQMGDLKNQVCKSVKNE